MKKQQSPLQRIKRVLAFYLARGYNSERCNKVYHKIIFQKFGITK